jgi:MFS family permease
MRNPVLTTRDGRLLLASQALTVLGHGISSVALPWLVLDGEASAGTAGLVFTFTVLPYVVFALAAGVVGDRFAQRQVIWISHTLQALLALAVPIWAVLTDPPVGFVLAAAFAVGAGRVFSDAAVFGALAGIVGKERLTHAQATLMAAWSVGLLAGPAIGGVLVATLGPGRALFVEAAAFAIGAVVARFLRTGATAPEAAPQPALTVVRRGLGTIFGDRLLRSVTMLGMVWAFTTAGAWALAVPLFREELELGSGATGAVLAAGAVGGIFAVPLVGALYDRVGGLWTLVGSLPLTAAATAALGVSSGLASALVSYLAFQLADSVTTAAYIGERQRRAPIDLQSSVGIFGRTIIMLSLAVGSAAASALADAVSLRAVYYGIAVLMVGLATFATVTLRRWRPEARPAAEAA